MLWKDKYKIGVPLIDEQHEELFRRVADFLETLRSGGEWSQKVSKVNDTLAFMKEYVVVHFHDEEAYQRSIGYPETASHSATHQGMVNYVIDFASQYESQGYQETLVQQFGGKLLAWLINHVVATDQKISIYAKAKGGIES